MKAPPKASELNAKSPFNDEELKRIHAACDKILPQPNPGPGYRTWNGQGAKDFINLSIYSVGPSRKAPSYQSGTPRATSYKTPLRLNLSKLFWVQVLTAVGSVGEPHRFMEGGHAIAADRHMKRGFRRGYRSCFPESVLTGQSGTMS